MSLTRMTAPPSSTPVWVRREWVMALGDVFTFDNDAMIYARNVIMAGGQSIIVEDTDYNVYAAVYAMCEDAVAAAGAVTEVDAIRGVRDPQP